MSALVTQLKNDHAALASLLEKVKSIGVNSPESKALLQQAKMALLNHLRKEDQELYPALKRAGASNEDVQRTVNNFAKDMDDITEFVLEFFAKIESNSYTPFEYASALGKLLATLSSRISREEKILYPLYDKI